MSQPQITQNTDSFHNLYNLTRTEDLLYLLSLKYTDGLSDKSLYRVSNQEDQRGLEAYQDLVDFQKDTYLKLRKEQIQTMEDQSKGIIRALVNSRNEFFYRSSMCFQKIAEQSLNKAVSTQKLYQSYIEHQPIPQKVYFQCLQTLITPSLLSNPSKWPWQIEDFLSSLIKKQIGSLFYEPDFARSEIHSNLSRITQNMKPEYAQIVAQARFELALREASIASLLQSLLLYQKYQIIPENFKQSLNSINIQIEEKQLHYMRSLCDSGVFHVNYIAQFAKLNFNSISLTSSPEYLYIIISCTNGVMLKIGTGQRGTEAGRVYYSKRIKRAEELAWVYLKGKLYLRSHSKEVGSIEVIDINTFQTVQTLNLHCPEIFQHPSIQIINKNYPILTDGEKLYIVGRRLNIQKEQNEQDKKEAQQRSIEQIKAEIDQQIKKREEKMKNQGKKKGEEKQKESEDSATQKLIEYVLYEFDVTNPDRNQLFDNEEDTSPELLNELYESFQGFFTKKECQRAMIINRNDIQAAVQWLTEEGEKERTKTTISSTKKTLLAQAEVTSDISVKNLKNNSEVTCSDRAILHPRQVSGNIWTMNKDQVTVYTEQGILIFSKNQNDLKNLPELKRTPDTWSEKISQEPQQEKKTNLKGTLLQVIDQNARTYYIHPGYCVSYETETKLFYTFHYQWNQQTNQFPCLITVSKDDNREIVSKQNPQLGEDFALFTTSVMIRLQDHRYNYPWKINDWEFVYVMILKDIEQRLQISSNEEDKKKLRSDKTKFINKLNKVIEFGQVIKTKPIDSSLREVKKSYMFQLNGDLIELQNLVDLILITKTPELRWNLLILIKIWTTFSDVSIGYTQEGFQLLRKLSAHFLDQVRLLSKIDKQQFDQIIDIVIENPSLFMQTNQQQIEWLELLIEHKESLIKFCKAFTNQNYYKESKLENEPKRDISITPQSEILSLYPKVNIQATQANFTEPWCRLLIKNIGEYSKEESSRSSYFKSFYIEGDKDITLQQIQQHQEYSDRQWKLIFQLLKIPSIYVHQFIAQLFENCWNQLTVIVQTNLEWSLKGELTRKVLLYFEETLSTFQTNASLELIDQLCSQIKSWLHYLFASSVTASPEDGDISHQLVKLFGIMRSYMEYKDNDGKVLNLLQMKDLLLLRTPGVDPTTEKTFETAHPYERGKMQYFEETHFPGALALLIEFDQRCSSDPSHDFLTISSWYTKQQQQGGISQAIRDPLGITYRISGKITIKRPIVLLGNHIQSEFHPSGHARNEHSLNRWGFKFTVKPIYGVEKAGIQKALKQEDLKPLQKLFTSDTAAQWINSMRLLSMLILENVHNLIGFDEIRTSVENAHAPFLKWTLLKNGPVNFQIDKYLVKQPGTNLFNLVNKLEFQDCSFLKSLSNLSIKNKDQPRYWQLKRELFKVSYHPNFDLIGDNIQQYQEIIVKEETLESLWETVINNNRILSDQLKQVKIQKGVFYEFALSLTQKFQDSYAYKQEKMRPSYKQSKSLWQQAEVLVVLVVLYHSGLMHIEIPNINQYLQSNLESLSDARNECINHMIMTVQVEKEWQQNADTIDQCWDELLENKKIQDELKQQTESSKSPSIAPQTNKKENQLDGYFVKSGNQLKFISHNKKKPQGRKERKNRSASVKKKEDTLSSLSQPSPPLAASKSEDQVIEKVVDNKRYIDETMEKALWQNFSLRLEGNSDMVIKLCRLRGIKTQGEEIQNLLKELFNDLINTLSDKNSSEYKDMMQSPYINQYNIIVRRGLLLLMINNVKLEEKIPHYDQVHSEQSVDSESLGHSGRKLKPPGIGRSVSHQLDDKNVDSQKLIKFRLWLDSYQKWKQLHSVPSNDEINCENPDIPPIKSVVSFLKSDQSVGQQLLEVMKIHDKRCVRRIVGLQVLNEFSNICSKRHGEMNNILSPLIQVSTGDILSQKIELSSVGAKQLLLNEIFKRLNFLINVFNDMTQQARNLNLVFQNTNQSTEQDAAILEQMKLVLLNGSEINQLLSLNDRKLWSHQQFCEQIFNTTLFETFLDNVLQTALLNVVLSNLGPNFQPFSLMAHHIVIMMRTTIYLVTDYGLPKQIEQLFKITIRILQQEIGISGQTIDSRQLVKLNDLIGLNRVNLLLSHIYDLIITNKSGYEEFDNHIIELLLFVLYHSSIPSTVRFSVKILKILFNQTKIDIWNLNSPLKKTYLWQTLNLDSFIDRIQTLDNIKRLQLKVETRTLKFELPTSDLVQDPSNPLMLIIQKLGQIIVAEETDKKSLQNTLQNELQQITYRMKPQRSGKQRTSQNLEEKRFKVLVQLCDEEEISHLVQVLYYWEELYPSVTLRLPKTIEEYTEVREREKKREESKNEAKSEANGAPQDIKLLQQAKALSQYKILERELLTHPDVIEFQEQLNLGWGFNQGNLFGDMKVTPTENKKQSTPSMRKSVKKNWTLPNTEELERRFDEFLKLPFDLKTLKTPEEIQVFLEQKNFARRIYQHIQEVMYLSRQLQVYGYGAFSDLFTLQRAQELMGLVKLSIEGRLEPIPLPKNMPEEIAKKLDPNQFLLVGTLTSKEQVQGQKKSRDRQEQKQKDQSLQNPRVTNNVSNMVVSLVDANVFTLLEFRMDYITLLPQQTSQSSQQSYMPISFYNEANRCETIGLYHSSGAAMNQVVAQLVDFLGFLSNNNKQMEQSVKLSFEKALINAKQETNKYDEVYVVGLSTIFAGWGQQIAPGLPVYIKQLKHEEQKLYIIEGGMVSGQKQCQLIGDQDHRLNIQQVKLVDIELYPQVQFDLKKFLNENNYSQLLQTIYLINQNIKQIDPQYLYKVKNLFIILRNLLHICGRLDWTEVIENLNEEQKQLFKQVLQVLMQQARPGPDLEFNFCQKWERLIDRVSPLASSIYYPQDHPFPSSLQKFVKTKTQVKQTNVDQCDLNEKFIESVNTAVLTPSSYVSSLPEPVTAQNEHKMLRYWENYIIPKMQDYVRGSLKPWEFEDFFEQIRQPLRKGDQAKALEISYIICDQRLPNGVIVPDANHDWSTLNVEELIPGQLVIARISDKNNEQTYSRQLQQLKVKGVQYLLGQVIGVEMRSSSVLILHNDLSSSHLFTTWFPTSALKSIQNYVPVPSNSLPLQNISEDFFKALQEQIAQRSFSLLMQLTQGKNLKLRYSIVKSVDIDLIKIMEMAIQQELQSNCIDAWLKNLGNQVELPQQIKKQSHLQGIKQRTDHYLTNIQAKHQIYNASSTRLNEIQNYMDHIKPDEINLLLEWGQNKITECVKFIAQNTRTMDLSKASSKRNPVALNKCQNKISGLCIVFKNDSVLCLCSGLKFYSDHTGVNNFHSLAAGKESRHKLPPLVFNQEQVYCEYFFNSEALPPYQQGNVTSTLVCNIYPIPQQWNTSFWLVDAISTSVIRQNNQQTIKVLQNIIRHLTILCKELSGPHLLVQQLFKLLMRTIRKLRYFARLTKLPGSNIDLLGLEMQQIIDWVEQAKQLHEQQKQELSGLYSAYLQDLVELIAVTVAPINKQQLNVDQLPVCFYNYSRLITLMDFIKNEGTLPEDIQSEVQSMLRIDQQWERVVLIKGLPYFWNKEMIYSVLEKGKARILNPISDIIIDGSTCFILLDGWASLDLEEESQDQKRREEQEQQQKEQEQPAEPIEEEELKWICDQCTFANGWEAPNCDMCLAPAPPNKKPIGQMLQEEGKEDEPPKVDLSAQEKQVALKDQERFNTLVQLFEQTISESVENLKNDNNKQIEGLQIQITTLEGKIEQLLKPEQPKQPQQKEEQQKLQQTNSQKGKKSKRNIPLPIQPKQQKQVEQIVAQPQENPEELKQKIIQLKQKIEELSAREFVNKSKIQQGKSIFQDQDGLRIFKKRLNLGRKSDYTNICCEVIKELKSLYERVINDEQMKVVAIEQGNKYLGEGALLSEVTFFETVNKIIEQDPIQVWKFFESMGYDFWLNESGLYHKETINQILRLDILSQLIRFIENDVCKETKAVLTYQCQNIRFPALSYQLVEESPPINYGEYTTSLLKYPELANSPLRIVRISWAFLKLMNQSLDEAGVFINMEIPNDLTSSHFKPGVLLLQTANYISVLRAFYMAPIKIELVQKVLHKTALPRDGPPKIHVERLKLARDSDQQKKINHEIISSKNKDDFLFTRAFEQMRDIPSTQLRPIKPTGTDPFLAFEINFKGEDVQGESGPYRQFYADISRELEPRSYTERNLNLLVPSINNLARMGNAKDKYVINPSARSTYQLQLFEFLGSLMGCSVRTATHFTLDLPGIFWKQLVGESVSSEEIDEVDATMSNLFQFLDECSPEMFETSFNENWVTLRSDRTIQELRKNGSKHQVLYHERQEYIDKLLQVKLTESEQQNNIIKKGLAKIIPQPLLNLITAQNLELWVCGRAKVDIDLLRRHTRYSGELNENAPRVKFLWEVLNEITEEEKLRFVKFCWGQERLPANDEEFERNQIRFMIKPATYATNQPDKALPKADTCFFNIELPKYSTKEILKQRLLTAINFDCDSMNAESRVQLDPNAHYRRSEEDSDYDDNYGEEEEQEEE